MRRFIIALLPLVSLGCEGKPIPVQPVATTTQPALKAIPSADYTCWKQFPIGTRVVRRKTMINEHGKVVVTTTLELASCDPKLAEVKSQITVVRDSDTTENPADILQFPANHSIPEDMSEEQFKSPVPDAQLIGEESVTVLDKTYKASVYRWKAALESGPVGVRGWFSDGFPGRQLRIEFDYSNGTSAIDEVVALQIPDSK